MSAWVWLMLAAWLGYSIWRSFFHGSEEDCPHCGTWLGDPEYWHAKGKDPPAFGGPRTAIQCPSCKLLVNRP